MKNLANSAGRYQRFCATVPWCYAVRIDWLAMV